VAAPFREVEVDILYGHGISKEGDLLDLAAANSVVEKSGSWYSFHGERIGQGRENARAFLIEHVEMAEKMDTELRNLLGLTAAAEALSKPVADEFNLKVAQSA
jgi:recombination protein RecA